MRWLFSLLFLAAQLVHAQATLEVEVLLNRSEDEGVVRLALCKGEAAYEKVKGCIERSMSPRGSSLIFQFEELAPGEYGIQALHDINSNGDMDFNFLGLPQEPYGFSNDAKVNMSAPGFDQAKFTVAPGRTRIRFKMRS
ncbi:MAG: DUF2141 domain-containing protein [Bacteroidota bacterium]|nr:DUF2141 domain-containing protein [Bacteroidota bacterium]